MNYHPQVYPSRSLDTDEDIKDMSHLAICPFDRSHMMKKNRLQYHITKCMKNYHGRKVPCPYDHTEYLEPENYQFHLSVCPSRKAVEVQVYNSNKNRIVAHYRQKKLTPSVIQDDNRFSDENWGLE